MEHACVLDKYIHNINYRVHTHCDHDVQDRTLFLRSNVRVTVKMHLPCHKALFKGHQI